jgi:hypothetical protein
MCKKKTRKPDEQKVNATKQLIASMRTVLTPGQYVAFKHSLMNRLAASH